ncbi:MAG: LTA synthase family protein [Actinomycetales bacterium]|nr:LTA synthase family protein [Actinomycetales bacterium]
MYMARAPRHASLTPRGARTRAPHRWLPWARGALAVVLTLVLAAAIALGLEWVHALNDPWKEPAERFAALQPDVLGLGVLITWAAVVLLLALTGSGWLTAGIALAGAVFVGFADWFKMRLRNEPLFPTDVGYLREAGLLVDSVGVARVVALFGALAAIVAASWGLSRAVARLTRGRWSETTSRRRSVALRVACGAVAAAVVLSAVSFNQEDNLTRRAYDTAGAFWAPWSQLDNYAKNGFLAGLLYNLPATAMDRPPDYSAETMAGLVERYRAVAAGVNATRDPGALANTNIVLVLGESVADPANLAGVEPAEDPLPFLRQLIAENTGGTMLSSGYGGGTANVEFEVLTGMAVSNFQSQVHSPFQMLVAQAESFPSWLAVLGEPARDTLTLHPYVPSFYRREVVYPVLGFGRSEFIADMGHTEKVEDDRYVSDAAVFAEVMDELRAADRPLLVNAVTMQNHGPQAGYSDPVPVSGPLTTDEAATIGQYLRGLAHTDAALRQFVADLAAFEEPTIVLYYGDHLAPVWPAAVLEQSGPRAQYSTPWVVFANFPTTKVPAAPLTGPNQLVTQMLGAAGAPITPYGALLEAVAAEVPAMETTMMLDSAGVVVPSEEGLSERARAALADYRLVQYDLTVGEGYAAEALFVTPSG